MRYEKESFIKAYKELEGDVEKLRLLYNVSARTIQNYKKKAGLVKTPKLVDTNKLIELYTIDGKTIVDIANYFGVSRDKIYTELKKHNITRDSKYNLEAIREAYSEHNYNIDQLLKMCGIVSRTSLYALLKRHNITNPIKDSIRELYIAGYTNEEIAKKLKTSISDIEFNLRHHSIYRERKLNISKQKLEELRAEGKKIDEIAKIFNCSSRTISEYIRKHFLKFESTKKWYFDDEKIKELYIDNNFTLDEIATEFGCGRFTLQKAVRELGIKKTNKETSIERKIRQLLEQHNIAYIQNTRKIISPKELDFFLPDYDIGIELCGIYWHSTKVNEDKYHIYNKYKQCADLGIQLVTIFEDEISEKEDIVYNRLKSILKLSPAAIYARHCVVKELSSREGIDFLNKYHIQGSGRNKLYLGAFYKNDLVAVMSFSKPNISKGAAKAQWELNRFTSINNIPGVASKLFKFFERRYSPETIVSYADLRWNTGNLYKQLGFKYSHTSKPNYWYVIKDKRKHRFNYTKQKLLEQFPEEDNTQTEQQIAEKHNLYRLYDCGNAVYIWNS